MKMYQQKKIKGFFNENAYAICSLAMHPANPTSTYYTINGGIIFDKYLDNNMDDEQHLTILKQISLVEPKKSN
ncbi:unnamed protein product [Rotaria sp. Silwood2]|nr:unnamed protein product [Rotaria sp. Silwood2]CAF2991312.1 unnamed protein product [Rotaria sp. Silwood2]CAF3266932.1 unnamed protein product [Rotaria sp. Silwood2]CAF4215991.1 unnamed protein product [Rotaria sp. Silwood2]CAF4280190.1 unnamed protein product [Rotaria sp. Silwood2]